MATETPVSIQDCLVFAQTVRYHLGEALKTYADDATQAERDGAMELVAQCLLKSLVQVANAYEAGVRLQAPVIATDAEIVAHIQDWMQKHGFEGRAE